MQYGLYSSLLMYDLCTELSNLLCMYFLITESTISPMEMTSIDGEFAK